MCGSPTTPCPVSLTNPKGRRAPPPPQERIITMGDALKKVLGAIGIGAATTIGIGLFIALIPPGIGW